MAIVRYNPYGIDQLQNEINRLFSGWNDPDSSAATAGWMPTVDISEFSDRFELYVDLPGVDPSKVDITLESSVLTISGTREKPVTSEDQDFVRHRTERGQGQFYRRFILPETVDADNVQATGRNGVLEISIRKQAKAQPRRIQVAA